jgi:hypothetical protein
MKPKPGDLVRNKNSEMDETGTFLGFRKSREYTYAEIYWPLRLKVGTIQPNLIEVVR